MRLMFSLSKTPTAPVLGGMGCWHERGSQPDHCAVSLDAVVFPEVASCSAGGLSSNRLWKLQLKGEIGQRVGCSSLKGAGPTRSDFLIKFTQGLPNSAESKQNKVLNPNHSETLDS